MSAVFPSIDRRDAAVGERLRSLKIAPTIVDELTEFGIGSVFTVEPA
jgi:hypothetical protein